MMTSHYTDMAVAAVAPAVAKTHNDRHKNAGKSRLHSTLAVAAVAVSTSRQDSKNFVPGKGKTGQGLFCVSMNLILRPPRPPNTQKALQIHGFRSGRSTRERPPQRPPNLKGRRKTDYGALPIAPGTEKNARSGLPNPNHRLGEMPVPGFR